MGFITFKYKEYESLEMKIGMRCSKGRRIIIYPRFKIMIKWPPIKFQYGTKNSMQCPSNSNMNDRNKIATGLQKYCLSRYSIATGLSQKPNLEMVTLFIF